jgi:ATP-dependent protease ClpP protease subunit
LAPLQFVTIVLFSYITLLGVAAAPGMLHAATFSPFWLPTSGAEAGVAIEGEIELGDASRFMATLNAIGHMRQGAHVTIVDLDTPGGLVQEGWAIATIVGVNAFDTGVYPGQTCASACSLIFFAGNRKILGAGARIGVHRASLTVFQNETQHTIDTSIWMAERLRSLGAPQAVVAKLLATPPSGIAWLSASDLAGVDGIVFGPPARGMLNDEYAAGWRLGRSQGGVVLCPSDLSQFASGCRAGAASTGASRP